MLLHIDLIPIFLEGTVLHPLTSHLFLASYVFQLSNFFTVAFKGMVSFCVLKDTS